MMNKPIICSPKPQICFVAHRAYGALAGVDTGHTGGIETQTSLMARWLAAHGHDIAMITWDEGQPDGVVVDGIRVFKMCRQRAGHRGLRFLHPRWTSLCHAMCRANADVYYYNCGDLGLGQVVMWCRSHGRKSVYSVASDPDCDGRLPVLKPLRERILYRYGLKHADAVIVQTQHQRRMLHEGFGIAATVIPMPCEGFATDTATCPAALSSETPRVLWVGRVSKEKRLEWLLDIAESCPEMMFDVVGAANSSSEYALALMKRAARIPNVKMHGRVPHAEIAKYYAQSCVLCCTSAYEGFPNTFLEAWSCGVPVVSTFDPDGLIAKQELGFVANDQQGIAGRLREISRERQRWLQASEAARQYYLTHHAPEVSLPRFERLFFEVAGRESRGLGKV